MRSVIAVLLVGLLACPPTANAVENQPLHVVASFSILGDMVKNIGGNMVVVSTLVGPDQDAHTYQPTPGDAKTLTTADIVFVNGLGFEGWMQRLIQASGTKAKIITLTDDMQSRIIYSLKNVPDPHAWQNPINGRIYARHIATALEEALPEQAQSIYSRAVAYDSKLEQLDQFIRSQIDMIPEAKRKIITSHDAFAYFGAAYGITFLSPVGISTEAEPSAVDVARLIDQIKHENIKRVFLENTANPKLIQQIAKDAGAAVGGKLYADSLSAPNGPASSYISMFQYNIMMMKSAMTAR